MNKQFTLFNTQESLQEVSGKILDSYTEERVFAFYGEMGAGKTTLIKAMCVELNVIDIAKSPSFAIINEYQIKVKREKLKVKNIDTVISEDHITKVFHFDFYRIQKEVEAYDLGYEEYFYSGNYCFIEWAERIEKLLPQSFVKVNIEVTGNNTRDVNCSLVH